MALNTLPVDGLRPILAFLDAEELTSLYCTFDRRIMQTMSFPGAVPFLCLESSVKHVSAPQILYFVRQVRNVTHLSLKDGVLTPLNLDLLVTLNPIRLDHAEVKSLATTRRLFWTSRDTESDTPSSQSTFFGFEQPPHFTLLTRRLEILKLNSNVIQYKAQESLSIPLPPTLTSLRGNLSHDLASLPSGLRSLTLRNRDLDLNELFSRLPYLEKLVLEHAVLKCENSQLNFPKTLTYLRLAWVGENIHPSSSIVSRLPTSLLRLDWSAPGVHRDITQYQLPTGLRVLNLLGLKRGQNLLDFSLLSSLERFSLQGAISVSVASKVGYDASGFCLSSLPPSVKSISINCQRLIQLSKDTEITPSLTALESLIVQNLSISELGLLRKYAPRCRAYLQLRSERDRGATLRALSARPPDDINNFMRTLSAFNPDSESSVELTMRCNCLQEGTNRSFVRRAIIERFTHLDLESMQDQYDTIHICSFVDSIALRGVAPYETVLTPPRPLTHMDLHSVSGTLDLSCLPKTLTRLSTKATFKVVGANDSTSQRGWPCTQMKHLDTPNGSFMLHHFGDLRGLDVFKATVINVADYNVMNWLTTAVAPKTRRNMSISMTYYITGAAVPDGDVDGLKDVTWSSICAWTTETLKRALASPWAISELSGTPSDDNGHDTTDNSIDTDTIGRVIKSFHVSETPGAYNPVCFPSSAVRVSMECEREIDVLPDMKLLPIEIDGSRVQLRDYSLLNTTPCLSSSSVTMLQVSHSLRFIQLLNLRFFPDLKSFSMPNLEVLILKRAQTSESSQFAFASLPTSLKTLALLGTSPWTLESSIPASFTLPNLSAALFEYIPSSDLRMQVWKALTKSPLKRFEVVETRTKKKQTHWTIYGIKIVSEISLDGLV